VDPGLWGWFHFPAYRRYRGRMLPGGPDAAVNLLRVGVSIRVDSAEGMRRLVALQDSDLELIRNGSHLARLGRVVAAHVTARGLERLTRAGYVTRVELDMVSPLPPPLDTTPVEVGAHAVWAAMDEAGLPISGAGVLIADIDSGIDPFHPAFFRADGGYYDWIDVDGNGRFEPGVDAVDLNGNGEADAGESVGFWDGVAYDLGQYSPILDTDNGRYDLGWDHLYVDTNDNGERDFGAEAGYGDDDPTYGEPLLVADDVNGNGQLDPGERLVALGTSKLRAFYGGGRTYERGEDLTEVEVTNDGMHGTGVAGILVGGQRGFSKLVGIAPEAELIMANTYDPNNQSGDLVPLLTWAVQQGAQVMLHEYAPWTGNFLDGSSNHEYVMDQAADMGVAQVNPAGNLGGSKKANVVSVPTQGELDLSVFVPQAQYPGEGDYHYVQVSLLWRDPERDLHVRLVAPDQEAMDLGADGTGYNGEAFSDGTTWVYAWREDSSRGTAKYDFWIFGQQGQSQVAIDRGTWMFQITDPDTPSADAPDLELFGYVSDDVSGWGVGAQFNQGVSERHLVCFPATADSAITVAAYTGHAGSPYSYSPEAHGELRRYSGRGVRIDGAPLMDIAAPDNPVTSLTRLDYGYGYDIGLGNYVVFGGTSGAGPHVAGAAALMKQLYPDLDGLEVRQALKDGALVDAQVTGDASFDRTELWGAGKLRIYAALFGETPADNTPPTVTLADRTVTAGVPVRLVPEVQDAEDPSSDLQVRWDDGYDGTWDEGPAVVGQGREVTFNDVGVVPVKVQVIDTGGLTAEAVARITVQEGATCDGGICPDGGPDAGPGVNPRSSGCGCNTDGGAPAAPLSLLLIALGLVIRRRRRG